jgi:hypothetical protein
MSGLLNTGIEFWQAIIGFFVVVLGVIGIRIGFQFDVNKFLEGRKESYIAKSRNACTHMQVVKVEDRYAFQSLMVSPPGTIAWHCQRCGLSTHPQEGQFERDADYYQKHMSVFRDKEKRFHKMLKKAGMV